MPTDPMLSMDIPLHIKTLLAQKDEALANALAEVQRLGTYLEVARDGVAHAVAAEEDALGEVAILRERLSQMLRLLERVPDVLKSLHGQGAFSIGASALEADTRAFLDDFADENILQTKVLEPWEDPDHPGNVIRPDLRCVGCGAQGCITAWGPWCFECNKERIRRIDAKLCSLLRRG